MHTACPAVTTNVPIGNWFSCIACAGVDAEMRMRLKTLYFFANRPTIGALIALGSDMGAALKSPSEVRVLLL